MVVTLTATGAHARDLSFLLRKHPDRLQTFSLPFGVGHIAYPQVTDDRCCAALIVEVDPVALVRGKPTSTGAGLVEAYVSDRPYVASSFASVAIARIFTSALAGRSENADMLNRTYDLEACVSPVRTDASLPATLFEPLGYAVTATPADVSTPDRVNGHVCVTIRAMTTVQRLLNHLYVLIPVLDGQKHYWVGDEEAEKLLRFGAEWLPAHPARELITRRYLRRAPDVARATVARLSALDETAPVASDDERPATSEHALERTIRLQDRRIDAVVAVCKEIDARSVADVGCGEGDLIARLARTTSITRLVGTDVSARELERAHMKLDRLLMPAAQRERIELFVSSVLYADARLTGFDALALLEVIEHIDEPRLTVLEKIVFGFAKPQTVIVTTPNREYNARFASLPAGLFRHVDHRFEWDRREFASWAARICRKYPYRCDMRTIGDEDGDLGAPTQMAVFRCV